MLDPNFDPLFDAVHAGLECHSLLRGSQRMSRAEQVHKPKTQIDAWSTGK
jgi:hypothetical protein